jgi:hypothetical protein
MSERPGGGSAAAFGLRLLCLSLAACGCGRGDRLATFPVAGRVVVDGLPLTRGSVTFVPERGRGSTGTLDAEGRYRLSTYAPGDGAVAGDQTVVISSFEPLAAADPGSGADMIDTPVRWLAPQKYSDPATSPLRFSVQPGGTNRADFEIDTGR